MTTETSPLPIAIVGLGFGRHIVNALQKPELKRLFPIRALCDLDTKKAQELAAEIGALVMTLDEVLADPAIPVVGLYTGPAGRAGLLRKIIRSGKDVMTTKPFERDSSAAREILAEAAQLRRVIHLNSPSPRLPADLAQIRLWQDKYDLGRPVSVQASAWVRYNETPTGNWYDDPALCPAAPIFRIGIYLINDAVEFLGEAEEVQVLTSRLFTKRPTPDHAQLNIKFRNGGLASILASFCVGDGAPYRNAMTLNFERGTAYRNVGPGGRGDGECKVSLVVPQGDGCTVADTLQIRETSGGYQWEDFHRAVLAGEVTPPQFSEKLSSSLKVIEAMAEAERVGGTVKLVP